MNKHLQTLEFHQILHQAAEYTHGPTARDRILRLAPIMDETLCQRAILDTSGAKTLLERCGTPPVAVMEEIDTCLHLAQAGAMLQPNQLYQLARFVVACERMADYLKRGESCEQRISFYGRSFYRLDEVKRQIETSVDEERVFDDASPSLRKLRREMEQLEGQMRDRLHRLVESKRKYLADTFISKRNGRYVLPVLRQYQNQIAGSVIDASRSGGTVFIEPASVSSMQQEWNQASFEEEQEVRRILYTLSDLVAENADAFNNNARIMDELDFLFAKGAYSLSIRAIGAFPTCGQHFVLKQARHPLLPAETCVPLNLELDHLYKGVVITGPNTGGKTVALKTIGLLSAMAQSGLHVPCDEASVLPMCDAIYCDIGDSQSISQNLSTFSGHMSNVIDILKNIAADSLVLLDELGSGTDPSEGAGIAVSILEALRSTGCFFMATTHYELVKNYVLQSSDILCARMAFDADSMQPLYKLELGKPGKSCAVEIVKRLGMPQTILDYAVSVIQFGLNDTHVSPLLLRRRSSSLIAHSKPKPQQFLPWQMGDSVEILPNKEIGIVYQPADERGNIIVQIKGEKKVIQHTRLRLLVSANELYPPDYDFSIVFDTVENRKARHILSKRYDEEATVVLKEGKK